IDPDTGEVLLDTTGGNLPITEEGAQKICTSAVTSVTVLGKIKDPIILESIKEDNSTKGQTGDAIVRTHEQALLKIYTRLRPGNPPQLEKARELFREKFGDPNRYRLGRVGRLRVNRKFDQDVPEDEMTLRSLDYLNAIRYIIKLRDPESRAQVDDIDHLENRRVRTIDE